MELVVARGPLPQGAGEQSPGQESKTQSVVENPEMVIYVHAFIIHYKTIACFNI